MSNHPDHDTFNLRIFSNFFNVLLLGQAFGCICFPKSFKMLHLLSEKLQNVAFIFRIIAVINQVQYFKKVINGYFCVRYICYCKSYFKQRKRLSRCIFIHASNYIHDICSTTEEELHMHTINAYGLKRTIIISMLNKAREVR